MRFLSRGGGGGGQLFDHLGLPPYLLCLKGLVRILVSGLVRDSVSVAFPRKRVVRSLHPQEEGRSHGENEAS